MFLDTAAFETFVCAALTQYETSAPTVVTYLDDLYLRVMEQPHSVRLTELLRIPTLQENGIWMQPNYAANMIYHLKHELGMETVGDVGF